MRLCDEVLMEMYRQKIIFELIREKELDCWLTKIVSTLVEPDDSRSIATAGEHRKQQWEDGWNENYTNKTYIPEYFGKYPVVRWNQRLVGAHDTLEYDMFCVLQEVVFEEYLADAEHIYEFGCGTGHNLRRAAWAVRRDNVIGLDWTDSAIQCTQRLGFEAYKFDMFHPNFDFRLRENSIVYTVAAMEQLGTNYKPFVQYLIAQKPKLVIHIEPIGELLDPANFMDYLSLLYFTKRKYLSGYLTYLEQLRNVDVIRKERSYIGSLFIDGYSLIVWRGV